MGETPGHALSLSCVRHCRRRRFRVPIVTLAPPQGLGGRFTWLVGPRGLGRQRARPRGSAAGRVW
eukprot:13488175-Alexandrium_andersonii.AAC.1